MIKALLNGLLGMLSFVMNIVMLPINAIMEGLFPNLANSLANFTTLCNTYITSYGAYIGGLLPPGVKSILVLWFTFLIGYYGVIYSYWLITNTWHLIQKIKFW